MSSEPRDYKLEAQRAAEERLHILWEAEEMGEYPEDYPALAPFCGCETCIVREVLAAAWDLARAELQEEIDARIQSIVDDTISRREL